jgi:AraC-like DNA-binding protein
MDYKEYIPPKQIAHLVECFWSNTLHPEDFQQDYDYIIPDGGADAIFMLNGNYLRDDEVNRTQNLIDRCSFVTPFHHAVKVYQKPFTNCLVIRFKPEAVQMLTGVSLGELDQPVYPLEEIMPDLADLAMNQINKNYPVLKVIDVLTQWLSKKQFEPTSNELISLFIEKTIRRKGMIGIKDFCEDLQIHKSTLEKNFKQSTGFTPKEYARVIRFNFLLNRVLFSPMNLTESSYEMGYFDQSHMIRDFKKITGSTPTDFIEKKFTVPKLAAMAITNKRAHL